MAASRHIGGEGAAAPHLQGAEERGEGNRAEGEGEEGEGGEGGGGGAGGGGERDTRPVRKREDQVRILPISESAEVEDGCADGEGGGSGEVLVLVLVVYFQLK